MVILLALVGHRSKSNSCQTIASTSSTRSPLYSTSRHARMFPKTLFYHVGHSAYYLIAAAWLIRKAQSKQMAGGPQTFLGRVLGTSLDHGMCLGTGLAGVAIRSDGLRLERLLGSHPREPRPPHSLSQFWKSRLLLHMLTLGRWHGPYVIWQRQYGAQFMKHEMLRCRVCGIVYTSCLPEVRRSAWPTGKNGFEDCRIPVFSKPPT